MIPFEDDKLDRIFVAEKFKNILLNTNLNVFSISAPWGVGKTYFIENLIRLMNNDSINILYNAWESDFYDSPLIPLFVELFAKLEEYGDELTQDIEASKKFAQNFCSKTSFQAGISFGVVNCSANFDPSKKMLDSEYKELKNEIKNFKKKLQNLQEKLGKKIIIFVDELDRCNPMYAIKTLEIIKHFFGIPNIIFVLSIDKKQIENAVRKIFGINIGEENGYLRKFIDIDFQLPDTSMEQIIHFNLNTTMLKIEHFIKEDRYYSSNLQRNIDMFGYSQDMDSNKEPEYLVHLILQVVEILRFSIRDIEKYFMRFNVFLDTLSPIDILLIEPCIVLNALAMYDMNEFNNYIQGIKSKIQQDISRCFPLWQHIFSGIIDENEYCNIIVRSEHNTQEIMIYAISQLLKKCYSTNNKEQFNYIRCYPKKIKFINNFDIFE